MTSWLDFIVLTLAASAVIDVWFNGEVFADWRAFFTSDPVSPARNFAGVENKLPIGMRVANKLVPAWVDGILSCPFCFSYHAPWIVLLICFVPEMLSSGAWHVLAAALKLVAFALAATRLGNLIDAWTPAYARYQPTTPTPLTISPVELSITVDEIEHFTGSTPEPTGTSQENSL